MSKPPFYITTPIFYVTDAPHIGHLYSTLACDILSRYHRLSGREVWFLTGTDEHGQKMEKKAKETGEAPQVLADRVVERYRETWKLYEITNDDFIRTTEERHKTVVTTLIKKLMETGDIYLSEYEGWYCVPDEAYWTESQIEGGNCPTCGRPLERLKEESYFFRMSAYEKKLLDHIEKNPNFIAPEYRKNEVLGFIRQGLKDISVSRTTIQWGIPMPTDAKAVKSHKVYVWFDALTNYYSALGPGSDKAKKFWPQAVHVVGKDILRFHAVYWPTFLMALGIELPQQIFAHGWLLVGDRKIGKSLGNAVDPISLGAEVGKEALRYFLFREFTFGMDGEYTKETVYRRINSDLANDYGNCINRLSNMVEKYLGSDSIVIAGSLKEESELKASVEKNVPLYHEAIAKFAFERALGAAWEIVSAVNRHIENNAPWTLAKSKEAADQVKLRNVLLHCLESLRVVSLLALPFIPQAAEKALGYLGSPADPKNSDTMSLAQWGKGPTQVKVTKGSPLFPRLEWKPTPA